MREKLEAAWRVYGPAPDPARVPFDAKGRPWPSDGLGPYTEEFKAWSKSGTRFHRLIDAEAWLDAAMMLVPEGCVFSVMTDFGLPGRARIWGRVPLNSTPDRGWQADGDTPAEALLAAIEKARTA